MTDLLIVGGSQDEEQALRSALGTVLPDGSVTPWKAAVKSLQDTATLIAAENPSVVAIGSALEDRALDLARHLERTDPLITTILLAEPDLTTLKAAIEVGVREVIAPGATRARPPTRCVARSKRAPPDGPPMTGRWSTDWGGASSP
jgi:hypothetical protein